jgi:predicted AAA+ superfamily ATPase
LNNGLDTNFYYWRDQNGNEVDIVIDIDPTKSLAIEIKAGQTINHKMLSTLTKWSAIMNNAQLILIYGGDQYQTRNGINILPINTL